MFIHHNQGCFCTEGNFAELLDRARQPLPEVPIVNQHMSKSRRTFDHPPDA
jgi:hypothetical protein